jgi:O-antigen/teichoic acid export membrane protein
LLSLWLFAVAARAFRRDLGTSFWRRASGPSPWTRGEVTRFLATGALTDTLKVISGRMDLLVLGFYHAPAAAAIYQAAWNLVDAANRLANPVSMVIFSDVAKLAAAGNGKKLMSLARRLSAAALVCVVPACLVLTFASDWIVHLIYGNAYAEAAPLLAVLSWTLVWLASIWLQPMLVSIGKQVWGLYFLFVVTPLKVGLLFVLVPGGGAMGLAWANLIYHLSAPLLLIPFWIQIRRVVLAPEFAAARG